jgi:hypothetical protein
MAAVEEAMARELAEEFYGQNNNKFTDIYLTKIDISILTFFILNKK